MPKLGLSSRANYGRVCRGACAAGLDFTNYDEKSTPAVHALGWTCYLFAME